MELGYFNTNDGTIRFNKYKMVIRDYKTVDKTDYTDTTYFMDEENAREWENNIIPKHQLLELVSKEEIDTSEYAWMEGIRLDTADHAKEIARIAAYGGIDAYNASLDEARDEYLLDLDCRISAVELGI